MRDPLVRQAVADLTRSRWKAQEIALVLDLSVRTVKRHRADRRDRKAAAVRTYDAFRAELDR